MKEGLELHIFVRLRMQGEENQGMNTNCEKALSSDNGCSHHTTYLGRQSIMQGFDLIALFRSDLDLRSGTSFSRSHDR